MLFTTETQQWAYQVSFHAFSLLRFKSNRADNAVKSRVRLLRDECHIQCKLRDATAKKSLCRHPDTASQFTLQRDELKTSLVTRQHWHIPGLHLSQEHRLLIRLVVFTNVKKTRKAVLLYFVCPVLYSHLHLKICFHANQCYTKHSFRLIAKHCAWHTPVFSHRSYQTENSIWIILTLSDAV